ncbi:MAG: hypothetical protein AB7O52_18650 [Planctomycetota bacterium]
MPRAPTPQEPSSKPPTLAALHDLLAQAATRPVDHLNRRLQAPGGSEWFETVVARAMICCDASSDTQTPVDKANSWRALKELGKERLRAARLTDEIEDATAIYFAAVILLLAHTAPRTLEEISTLPVSVLEEGFVSLREVLDGTWADRIDLALQFID